LKTVFDYDGGGRGKGGKISLFANDKLVCEGRLESTLPFAYSLEGVVVDLGKDLGSPVIPDEYQGEFPFNGTLEKVVIELGQ
jgi:arylsulfatase